MTLGATLDVATNGDVELTFSVTHTGSDPVELTFRSGKRADVVVTDAETGEQVWQWGERRMFTQALSTVEVSADEAFEETFTWRDPPAGRYEAEATLEAASDVSATATFTV